MTSTRVVFCFVMTICLGLWTSCLGNLLGIELDEAGVEFLNEYLSLDESRYLAELKEFQDAAIEIDLIDSKKHRRRPHQTPRVLYQVGVSFPFVSLLLHLHFSSIYIQYTSCV